MEYQNNLQFAAEMDEADPLKHFRNEFLIPQHNGRDAIYLCGNSLGLQPKAAKQYLNEQLDKWHSHAVEGWFDGDEPWINYHKQLAKPLSAIVGALESEVSVMNSLTVNLHLLLVSFYKPNQNRYKIIMEGGAFPSDQYAIESQVRYHGYQPSEAIIEVFPREGEHTLRTEDILQKISEHANELALVLFGGINYYTGQLFDLRAITGAAHEAGAYAGFDLAHAAGNVPLQLHRWGVDFACWCSYKYMNSGPGGISGIFINEKHFNNPSLPRFAGWWGYRQDKRFLMAPGFDPAHGADGWQVSTSAIMLMALHKASLDIFERAGIENLRNKALLLTGYLEFIINQINDELGAENFKIITPAAPTARGSQLSIICKNDGRKTFEAMQQAGIIGDWREPDVIRLAPVPLYSSFTDVFHAGQYLAGRKAEN